MIHRAYIAKLGTNDATDLEIIVTNPGLRSAPFGGLNNAAGSATIGAYFEIRDRPIRVPVLVGQTGFVPRCALGFHLTMQRLDAEQAPNADIQILQLSESLVGPRPSSLLSSTDAVPLIPDTLTAVVDPTAGPCIRLNNHSTLAGHIFLVNFSIFEAKDEDYNPDGSMG